jgi:hypothetical protein
MADECQQLNSSAQATWLFWFSPIQGPEEWVKSYQEAPWKFGNSGKFALDCGKFPMCRHDNVSKVIPAVVLASVKTCQDGMLDFVFWDSQVPKRFSLEVDLNSCSITNLIPCPKGLHPVS